MYYQQNVAKNVGEKVLQEMSTFGQDAITGTMFTISLETTKHWENIYNRFQTLDIRQYKSVILDQHNEVSPMTAPASCLGKGYRLKQRKGNQGWSELR